MKKYYLATVGLHTKETILMGIRRFECNHIILFPALESIKIAEEIKNELMKFPQKFNLEINNVVIKEVKASAIWENVNVILKEIKNIFKGNTHANSKQEKHVKIIFDISGGTRLMSLSALIAASLIRIKDIYYILPYESLEKKEREFKFYKVPSLALNPFSKTKIAILNVLKSAKNEKKTIVGLNHLGLKLSKEKSIDIVKGRLSTHISELKSYNLVKAETMTGKRKYVIEITNEGLYYLDAIELLKEIKCYLT